MNWGKGIVLGMSLFMAFIISMCVYMFNLPVDDYDHQYYEKGLNFNGDYNREQQVVRDNAQPLITQTAAGVAIEFKQPATGVIKLVNPLGKSKDLVCPLNTGADKHLSIPANKFTTGRWGVKIEWSSGKKHYLYQQNIFINGK
ncbi:FixH family protein [Mucilaginibacter sp.]|uniref:FixH family protein n=1 Tax=Mucilaginibacter sp. TaxID=1882438 RepID=UPI003264D4A2